VRPVTLIVFVFGTIYALVENSFGKIDHGDTFMRVYIPAVMLFAPWGETFSLDSVFHRRQGMPVTSVSESSLRYSWSILFLLWLLCIMFMGGGLIKAIPPGQWLLDPNLLRKFMLEYNVIENPVYLRYWLSQLPVIPTLLLYMGLAFETFYPLAAINKTWRRFYISSSVLFHIGTGIMLGIQFTPMLFFYILFFDLQSLYDRFFPKRLLILPERWLKNWSSSALVAGTLMMVAGVIFVRSLSMFASVLRLPNDLIWNYAWWIAGPIAVYGIVTSAPVLLQRLVARLRRSNSSIPKTRKQN
ncbi:MAG TPA: hypothetical protein VHL11_20875, partial [Phototrophicaceae bacterium]|nr:hypothetical protein [Phototrophicaceae bacterium]